MPDEVDLMSIRNYFSGRFKEHGATPQGLDWNSHAVQNIRFTQLAKIFKTEERFSLIDYGCGYGAFYDFLTERGFTLDYCGFEIVEEMAVKGRALHNTFKNCHFTTREDDLRPADYVVESGVFNIKLATSPEVWTNYVLKVLKRMDVLSTKGMAFNLLTKYSDPEYMRDDLYYADPCFFFDYCKKHFSRNVALLHDYQLYDFTIIVRKDEGHG